MASRMIKIGAASLGLGILGVIFGVLILALTISAKILKWALIKIWKATT